MRDRIYPCEFCDTEQEQVQKHVTVTRQRKGEWFIFEGVSAWVCPHCGHRYFDAEVLEAMENRMASTPEDAKKSLLGQFPFPKKQVEVINDLSIE